MIRWQHRGSSIAIDRVVLLPDEHLAAAEKEDMQIRVEQTIKRGQSMWQVSVYSLRTFERGRHMTTRLPSSRRTLWHVGQASTSWRRIMCSEFVRLQWISYDGMT